MAGSQLVSLNSQNEAKIAHLKQALWGLNAYSFGDALASLKSCFLFLSLMMGSLQVHGRWHFLWDSVWWHQRWVNCLFWAPKYTYRSGLFFTLSLSMQPFIAQSRIESSNTGYHPKVWHCSNAMCKGNEMLVFCTQVGKDTVNMQADKNKKITSGSDKAASN